MATFMRFEDIFSWQLARQLCIEIQKVVRVTPLARDLKLRDQVCASSESISSDIAEGFGRSGTPEFI
jgi:four helix bundle protein